MAHTSGDVNWNSLFLFARAPDSGIDASLTEMRAAGFTAIFVNTRDYPENRWTTIRQRAEAAGMLCGPWGRTAKGPNDLTWAPEVLLALIDTADRWHSPLVANPEKEIDFSGDDITTFIADALGSRDAAISTLARPMTAVDWRPLKRFPLLAQLFVESQQTDPENVKHEWHAVGIDCAYGTLGAYGGRKPDDYPRIAPYSVYTADDVAAGNFSKWSPRSSGYVACKEVPPVTPPLKTPLTVAKFPYTGPFYGPSHPKGPTKNSPSVKGLKRGLVRGGFLVQDLPTVTDDFGVAMEDALKRLQRRYDLEPTGQYGLGSWEVMRRLPVPAEAPNAGQYAMDSLALKLVKEDTLRMCYPHPLGSDSSICQGLHETDGLGGSWAIDFCAPGGTKVLAVERGEVIRLSGSNPNLPPQNAIGIWGWSIHVETADGYVYFTTHYGSRAVQLGDIVDVGDVIGAVGSWPGDPGRSHTHYSVRSPKGTADAKRKILAVSTATRVSA